MPQIVLVLALCLLAGCGMKGDLYAPEPPDQSADAPAAAPDAVQPDSGDAPDGDKDGRKSIPVTPEPSQSR